MKRFILISKITIIFLTQVLVYTQAYSQEKDDEQAPEKELLTTNYLLLSIVSSNPVYRDYATSPLFFRGTGLEFNSAWLKRSDLRERLFQYSFGANAMAPSIPESNFIQPEGFAVFSQFNLYYHQLWKLAALSDEKNNVKVGGALITSQNFRVNPSLQNNALGVENLTNLMATAQLTRDISRKETKELNLLLFKPTLKPMKRDLRFLFNLGLINLNYRPSYAFTYDGEIIGLETNPLSWLLSNYGWSWNGWRLNTQIEYVQYLPNGNARGFSYVWEAAHAPGRHEAFQMANHRIQYTLYFQTKTR